MKGAVVAGAVNVAVPAQVVLPGAAIGGKVRAEATVRVATGAIADPTVDLIAVLTAAIGIAASKALRRSIWIS
jgi:hypothetical protein